MTLATSKNKEIYVGNGSTTIWPITFRYLDEDHLKIYLTAPGGAPVLLSSGYYIDNENSRVLYPGYAPGEAPAPAEQPPTLPDGWKLTILREVPLIQETDLTIGGGFRPRVLEDAYDYGIMASQQLLEALDRAVKLPVDAAPGAGEAAMGIIAGYAAEALASQNAAADSEDMAAQLAAAAADSEDMAAQLAAAVGATVAGNYLSTLKLKDVLTKGRFVDVRAFGAVGDGLTDDTAAIQNAVSFSDGYDICFGLGNYLVNGSIDLKSNLNIWGRYAVITQTAANTPIFVGESVSNLKIESMGFFGVGTDYSRTPVWNPPTIGASGIAIAGGENINIENNNFKNFGLMAIYLRAIDGFLVDGNTIIGTGSPTIPGNNLLDIDQFGIYLANGCNDGFVQHNKISEVCVGVYQSHDNASNIYTNNTIFDIRGQHGFYLADFDGTIISNNIIKNTNGIGIKVQIDASSTKDAKNLHIIGNVIEDYYTGIVTGDTSTAHTYRFKNVVILGNVLKTTKASPDDGIKISYIDNGIVSQNHIEGCRHGISLAACTGLVVRGNKIKFAKQVGILFRDVASASITIADNEIIDPAQQNLTNYKTGIVVDLVTDVIVENNLVSDSNGYMQYSLMTYSATNGKYANNKLLNGQTRFYDAVNYPPAVWDNNDVYAYYNYPAILLRGRKGKVYHFNAAPMTGTYSAGDIVYNTAPAAAGYVGWVCTVAGTPGTWKGFGTIDLQGSATWDPGSLADGAGETSTAIAVTGAALGDFVLVAAPYDLQGMICNGYVSAANTVKIRLQNETGGPIDLASGTWKVKVVK